MLLFIRILYLLSYQVPSPPPPIGHAPYFQKAEWGKKKQTTFFHASSINTGITREQQLVAALLTPSSTAMSAEAGSALETASEQEPSSSPNCSVHRVGSSLREAACTEPAPLPSCSFSQAKCLEPVPT